MANSAKTLSQVELKAALADIPGAFDAFNKFCVGGDLPFEETTIVDIVRKLRKWGSVSDKQRSFLGRLVQAIADRPAKEAARAAEVASAQPIPVDGDRITVTGVIVATPLKMDRFHGCEVRKLLFKADEGFKLWGNCPSALCGEEPGTKVEFSATVKRSPGDEKFGFFSRPTKVKVAA